MSYLKVYSDSIFSPFRGQLVFCATKRRKHPVVLVQSLRYLKKDSSDFFRLNYLICSEPSNLFSIRKKQATICGHFSQEKLQKCSFL